MREVFSVYDDSKTTKEASSKSSKTTKRRSLFNYLPVGSHDAVRFYAHVPSMRDVLFVNCMPEFIGSDKSGEWPKKFEAAGLPVLGDDIKSQVALQSCIRTLVSCV